MRRLVTQKPGKAAGLQLQARQRRAPLQTASTMRHVETTSPHSRADAQMISRGQQTAASGIFFGRRRHLGKEREAAPSNPNMARGLRAAILVACAAVAQESRWRRAPASAAHFVDNGRPKDERRPRPTGNGSSTLAGLGAATPPSAAPSPAAAGRRATNTHRISVAPSTQTATRIPTAIAHDVEVERSPQFL